MKLKFTAYTIAKLERENKDTPFHVLLNMPGMWTLIEFVKAGTGLAEDEAGKVISEYMSSGKTFEDVLMAILKQLEEDHFLQPGGTEVLGTLAQKGREAMQGQLKALHSQRSGKEESPMPSPEVSA